MSYKQNNKPIAIYNADKKELMGIFLTGALVSKYIYQEARTNSKDNRIFQAIMDKGRIHNSVFPFPIAARYASPEQIALLGEELFLICGNYPIPEQHKMKGFVDYKADVVRKVKEVAIRKKATAKRARFI